LLNIIIVYFLTWEEKMATSPMVHLARVVEQLRHGKFKPVHERYGKWAKLLEHRPEMSRLMHQEGKTGLARFGYEPQAEFIDFPMSSTTTSTSTSSGGGGGGGGGGTGDEDSFVCDASVVCEHAS
jgi:hypothetical protein